MTFMNNVADLGAASSKDAAEAAVLVKEEVKTPEEVAPSDSGSPCPSLCAISNGHTQRINRL